MDDDVFSPTPAASDGEGQRKTPDVAEVRKDLVKVVSGAKCYACSGIVVVTHTRIHTYIVYIYRYHIHIHIIYTQIFPTNDSSAWNTIINYCVTVLNNYVDVLITASPCLTTGTLLLTNASLLLTTASLF